MSDEQLIDMLVDEEVLAAYCNPKYCPYYEEDGGCSVRKHNKTVNEGCAVAAAAFLNGEVSTGNTWYE